MAQLNFDARTVAPDAGQMDPVPAAWYNMVIDQSELKPTKDATGLRLELRFNIIDGQYAGRKIFEGLNLKNSNVIAQEIAFKQLSAIAHAVGVLVVADSTQLHNIPLKCKVKVTPPSGTYEARNQIVAYKNINEVVSSPAGAPAGFAAPAAPVPPASFAPPPAFAPAAAAPAPAWTPPAAPAAPAAPVAAPQPWAAPAAPQPWAAPAAPVAAAPVAAAPAPEPVAPLAAPAALVAPAAAPAAAGAMPPWATPAA